MNYRCCSHPSCFLHDIRVLCLLIILAIVYQASWIIPKSLTSTTSNSSTSKNIQLFFRTAGNEEEFDDRSNNETTATNNTLLVFRILQIADIHLGENSWSDWGPEQDRKTWIALDKMITSELLNNDGGIDLIVLSGDQITGNNIDDNATLYYRRLGHKLSYYGIPFCFIFGNHDDSPFENPNGTTMAKTKTNRAQLVHSMNEFDLSLTQVGPTNVFGVTNYWLNLYKHNSSHFVSNEKGNNGDNVEVAARILLLDSGGGSLPQEINQSQIDWIYKSSSLDFSDDSDRSKFNETASNNHETISVPIIAFQHIPSSINDFNYQNDSCYGLNGEDGLAPLEQDAGIVEALISMGNVHFLAVGHNHGNDYCCCHTSSYSTKNNDRRGSITSINIDEGTTESDIITNTSTNDTNNCSIHICFGRHSGYGGYGSWDRGARVYELELLDVQQKHESNHTNDLINNFRWKSWVRLESGEIVDEYVPSNSHTQ